MIRTVARLLAAGGVTASMLAATTAAAPSGAAAAAAQPAAGAAPRCAGVFMITGLAFSPAQVQPGQTATANLAARNCTGRAQQATAQWYGRYLGPGGTTLSGRVPGHRPGRRCRVRRPAWHLPEQPQLPGAVRVHGG